MKRHQLKVKGSVSKAGAPAPKARSRAKATKVIKKAISKVATKKVQPVSAGKKAPVMPAKAKQVSAVTSSKSNQQLPAKVAAVNVAEQAKSKTVAAGPIVTAPVATKAPALSVEELILTHRENGRKLARSLLRRWRVVMPHEEVDSIVDLTLCEAAKRYSAERGASFITFLFYHLRGHLVRGVASATQDSRMFLALAQGAGIDTSDWSTQGDDHGISFLPDLTASLERDAESPEGLLLKKEKTSICDLACAKLDELEREVIDRSYIQDEPLVDIARSLGYSRCHISRVKKRALDRLREYLLKNSLVEPSEIFPEADEDGEEAANMARERIPRRRRRRRAIETVERDTERHAA